MGKNDNISTYLLGLLGLHQLIHVKCLTWSTFWINYYSGPSNNTDLNHTHESINTDFFNKYSNTVDVFLFLMIFLIEFSFL